MPQYYVMCTLPVLLTLYFMIWSLSVWRCSNVSLCDCSLFAVEAGAGQVFACDCSSTMIQIASDVLHANGAADKVTLINKLSTDVIIPVDMPARWSFSTNYIQLFSFLLCVCGTICLYNLSAIFTDYFHPEAGGSKFLWSMTGEQATSMQFFWCLQHTTYQSSGHIMWFAG